MKFKKTFLHIAVLFGVLMSVQQADCYLVPINSSQENAFPNMKLMIEAEITRWQQEALKYQEMLYTDLMGKVGGGSLGMNNVISQTQEAAKDGVNIIQNTTAKLEFLPTPEDYKTAKENIEKYYLIRPEIGQFYSTDAIRQIQENQRTALNDLTVASITQASVDTVGSFISKTDSEPETRAKDIAKAKDLNAMLEMLTAMDRKIYERSLQSAALEAADAGVQAMLVLKGISTTGRHTSGQVEK